MTSASMTGPSPAQTSLIERVERALLLLAYFIELDGDVHVPMYEKFEAELAELKTTADAKARASERLAAYRRSGDRNAIVVRNFDVNSRDGAAPNLGSSV
jgi:hypothetical protein